MSTDQTSSTGAGGAGLAIGTLESLAARVRSGGLCLGLVGPDGELSFFDYEAGTLFSKYLLPMFKPSGRGLVTELGEKLKQVEATSAAAIWNCVPGMLIAGLPLVERRQLAGVFIVASRAAGLETDDRVDRLCARLGVNPEWLRNESAMLEKHDEKSLERKSKLLLTMVRDQIQVSNLQGELDSLSNQLANTYEELSLIYQVSGGMRINRRADDFFKQACADVLQVMGVRGLGVALCGEQANRQHPVLYGELELPPGAVKRLAEELTPLLCLRNSPLLVNDLKRDSSFSWLSGYVTRMLAVPMQRQDQMLGFYFALEKENGDFDSQDSKMLNSIANESAIFLENAMLYDDVHGLMMGLMHSLTSAVDAKDAYTHGHSERVAALGRALTIEAGLGEPLAERVYMAGLLHDVGKIGVPESVLHKTGRLTPEEFEQMKKHPQIGARILADVKQVRDLIPGVLHHHERYDGNGYPHGLAGENIPEMGRIICLADCFDAMTSNRTYRKAMPLEVALTEIRRCSGTQFDPGLAEAFLRIGAARLRELVMPAQRQERISLLGAA
jgi:HD-GYP domain-containing protein (c-di-GMP phosphodiesterase class II)